MRRTHWSLVVGCGALCVGCVYSAFENVETKAASGGAGGSGGASAAGGSMNAGGAQSNGGGASVAGDASALGGSTTAGSGGDIGGSSGGTLATLGGTLNAVAGTVSALGGAMNIGGSEVAATGGLTSAGGSVNIGGATSAGGVGATGGATSAGGVGATGGTTNLVTSPAGGGTPSTGGAGIAGNSASTGGAATGGAATGGAATGGAATGGAATGGAGPTCAESNKTITSNQSGNHCGYYYELWKDAGTANMILNADGFSLSWSGINNVIGRKGLKPGSNAKLVTYEANYKPNGNSYLSVYGWTDNPLIEFYIVESWGSWRPPGLTPSISITCDGGSYDLYKAQRVNQPSPNGNTTFYQYWSVRQQQRASGTITLGCHFDAWAANGMSLGSMIDISMAVEGYQSSGTADVKMTME